MLQIFGWDDNDFRCVPCLKAKRLAESQNVPYDFYPCAKNDIKDHHRDNMVSVTNLLAQVDEEFTSLPQIFYKGKLIGGFAQFKEHVHFLEEKQWATRT